MTTRHPPVESRPRALWSEVRNGEEPRWTQAFDDDAVDILRGALPPEGKPLERRTLGLLPYRPDLLRRIGPGALRHGALRAVLFACPACALSLATGFYDETSPVLEPSLAGSGEAVFHLLEWAARHGRDLRQPASFYRRTLITDCYWGFRHARRTGDPALPAEIDAWCGDERRQHASAAACFLLRQPREPVAPYREIVASNPFYAYLALPRLSSRGFMVEPGDVAGRPKWAFHFALSGLTRRPERFFPLVAGDPGWAVELGARLGWLDRPEKRVELSRMILSADEDHPLRGPALHYLSEVAQPQPAPAPLWPAEAPPFRSIPSTLTSGQAAESRVLEALQMAKNTGVWRPSLQQIDTPAFRQIVGSPRYTGLGRVRGTVVDSLAGGLAEIKSGSSVLNSTYQLRLQTYRAVMEDRLFRIYTNRPIDVEFGQWLRPWGVKIEPLPDPSA